jgi:large repetitive protein
VTVTVNVVDTTPAVITVPSGPLTMRRDRSLIRGRRRPIDVEVPLASSTVVDGFTPGVYTLTYDHTDAAGNASTQVTVTVNVVDTTAAVITVPDPGPLTHEAGSPFVDPGATVLDAVDGLVNLTSSTPVDGLIPGIYTLTYDYTDTAGNPSVTVTVTVNVVDTTPAVITVPDPGPLTHEAGSAFIDPGATATDAVDGVVPRTTATLVDGFTPGVYFLTYSYTDAAGNTSPITFVTVNVVDTTPAVITVPDPGPLTHEAGTAFVDPGATATDAVDGVAALTSSTSVDGLVPGVYTLTYDHTDAAGNASATVTVTVNVVDTTPAVITVPDPGPLTHEAGTAFVDPGATATDIVDGSVPVASSTAVDGFTPGVYTLTYGHTDAAGNASTQVTVTVNVVDRTGPTITVIGDDPIEMEAGDDFAADDPGVTAIDIVDGDVTFTVVADYSDIQSTVPGDYTVTYTAFDLSGTASTATRTVRVVDTVGPAVTEPSVRDPRTGYPVRRLRDLGGRHRGR